MRPSSCVRVSHAKETTSGCVESIVDFLGPALPISRLRSLGCLMVYSTAMSNAGRASWNMRRLGRSNACPYSFRRTRGLGCVFSLGNCKQLLRGADCIVAYRASRHDSAHFSSLRLRGRLQRVGCGSCRYREDRGRSLFRSIANKQMLIIADKLGGAAVEVGGELTAF